MKKLKKTFYWLWASYKNDKKGHNIGVEKFLIKTLLRILKRNVIKGV